MRAFLSALALAVTPVALLFAVHANAEPINLTNAGFETTTLTNSSQFGTSYGGQTVNGWTGSGYTFLFMPGTADSSGATGKYGNIQLWGPGNGADNGLTESPDGGNFIAMDGAFQNGTLSTLLTGLTVGDVETITFWYAGVQQQGFNGATTEGFTVQFGDQVLSTAQLSNVNHGFTGWTQESMSFIATNSTETLTFLAQGTPDGVPPFSLLDGVAVTQTTPEPSSLVMLATGVAGVAGALRRRYRQVV